MRTDTVKLAGKEYTLKELPLKRNAQFRQRIQGQWSGLVPVIEVVVKRDLDNVGDWAGLVQELAPVVVQAIGSADAVTNLVLEYMFDWRLEDGLEEHVDPDDVTKTLSEIDQVIPSEVAHILDNAYESEIFDAFLKVLGLVFPFFEWGRTALDRVTAAIPTDSGPIDGSQNGQTTTNLQKQNTGSGRRKKAGQMTPLSKR